MTKIKLFIYFFYKGETNMNQKKNIKIVIILIIITLMIILLGGVAFLYLATDLFKSDKELFFQYAAQIGDSEEGILESSFKQYWEKKKITPYTNEGNFKTNIISENEQEEFENINHFNITFSGQVDTANAKSAQDISLNYSDTVNFPISYKQIGKTIGLQTKYVGSKYIAFETDKLEHLPEKTIVMVGGIKNRLEEIQEATQVQLTEEEKNQIQNTYMAVLNQQLSADQFTKVKQGELDGYQLTLNGENLKNVLVKLLETLKNDQMTLEKINEYLKSQKNSAEITVNDIEKQIDRINNDPKLKDEKIEITIYEQKRKVITISIVSNELKIEIQKENNQNELNYHIKLETNNNNETDQINLDIGYTGIDTMQKVEETYSLKYITSQNQYQWILENNIDFTENKAIEEFVEENTMLLTDYEPEQVDNFLQSVTERITQVNKQQMEELGLEENENPLLAGIIMPFLEANTKLLAYHSINQTNMSEEEINTFNQKFEMYESTNLKGVTVKGLLSTISFNNESQDKESEIREINFKGEEYEASEQNIAFIKQDIDTEKSYRVEFEKDQDTGIIYRAVINEK